jgi:hypothetical protein
MSMSRLPSISYDRTFRYNGKKIRRTNIHQFEFRFNVTQKMVPSCRILVYYVKMDKETVGDSIVFNVEEKLENQVMINGEKKQNLGLSIHLLNNRSTSRTK